MPAILSDHNIRGHFEALLRVCNSPDWRALWEELGTDVLTFDDLGLPADTADKVIWELCQQRQLVLITANRNRESSESLEAAIQEGNTPFSLPVLTIADPDQVLASREYAERVVERLMEYLIDLENIRGTGRLYLP